MGDFTSVIVLNLKDFHFVGIKKSLYEKNISIRRQQ